jgi:hypothetical protein
MSEAQSASRSRLELARDEVDRVFGEGTALARAGRFLHFAGVSPCRRVHAGAAVTDVMNSRLFTRSPRRHGRARSGARRDRAPWQS